MNRYRTFNQHLDKDVGPKRILSLDGGGLRGMMSLQVLYRLECLLKERFNDGELRLADYFDLIGGGQSRQKFARLSRFAFALVPIGCPYR